MSGAITAMALFVSNLFMLRGAYRPTALFQLAHKVTRIGNPDGSRRTLA